MWQQSDVERIEREFDIELTPDFRELVLTESFDPRESEPFKSGDDDTAWLDLDQFIELNACFVDADCWDPNVFVFAGDCDGNFFGIEIDTGDVVYRHHEDADFSEVASFADWVTAPFEPEAPELPVLTQYLGCTGIALVLLAVWDPHLAGDIVLGGLVGRMMTMMPTTRYCVRVHRDDPEEWHEASATELYQRLFHPLRIYVPPLAALNDKLRSGKDMAGEHGIHIQWEPCELTAEQYQDFRRYLLTEADGFLDVEAPPGIETWDDWSMWAMKKHYLPGLESSEERDRRRAVHEEEMNLRRAYRKALVREDRSEAERLASKIRAEYDPDFS